MPTKWIDHVKSYQKQHKCTYKRAMTESKHTYNKSKTSVGGKGITCSSSIYPAGNFFSDAERRDFYALVQTNLIDTYAFGRLGVNWKNVLMNDNNIIDIVLELRYDIINLNNNQTINAAERTRRILQSRELSRRRVMTRIGELPSIAVNLQGAIEFAGVNNGN
jgi:hypothetical protein